MPELTSGSMTSRKIWNSDAPSMRAAWASSVGRSAKNARMKNVPNETPVLASTRLTPTRLSSIPMPRSWKYSGIM